MLEWTDSKQVASNYPALALHQLEGGKSSQKLQANLRGGPDWQPQPSQAEHTLRDEPSATAEKQQNLNPLGVGAAQPDASQLTPSIQAPPLERVGAAALPGVGFEGMQSPLNTETPTTHVGAAPQHVVAALEKLCQPTQSRGDAQNMRQSAACGPLHQLPADVKQPAAGQIIQ